MLLKLGADVKNRTLLQDCGESDINYSIDLVMIERTVKTVYPNGREARKEFYKYKKKEVMDLFIYLLVGLPLSLLFLYIIFDILNRG